MNQKTPCTSRRAWPATMARTRVRITWLLGGGRGCDVHKVVTGVQDGAAAGNKAAFPVGGVPGRRDRRRVLRLPVVLGPPRQHNVAIMRRPPRCGKDREAAGRFQ